jgi:hypothetical protein
MMKNMAFIRDLPMLMQGGFVFLRFGDHLLEQQQETSGGSI